MISSNLQEKRGAKVLVIEDDDSMRRFLEVTLGKANFRVSVAKDGIEGLETALENDFDVIITDAVMPNMTGYDLCRILRQTPQKQDIPLIILSGFELEDDSRPPFEFADFRLRKGNNLKNELFDVLSGLKLRSIEV